MKFNNIHIGYYSRENILPLLAEDIHNLLNQGMIQRTNAHEQFDLMPGLKQEITEEELQLTKKIFANNKTYNYITIKYYNFAEKQKVTHFYHDGAKEDVRILIFDAKMHNFFEEERSLLESQQFQEIDPLIIGLTNRVPDLFLKSHQIIVADKKIGFAKSFSEIYLPLIVKILKRYNAGKKEKVFISYTRNQESSDIVKSFKAFVDEQKINTFFDITDIDANIKEDIVSGLQESTLFVPFLSDNYFEKSWCLFEMIESRKQKIPMVVCDITTVFIPRMLEYVGNYPAIKMSGAKQSEYLNYFCIIMQKLLFQYQTASMMITQFPNKCVLTVPPSILEVMMQVKYDHLLYPEPILPKVMTDHLESLIQPIKQDMQIETQLEYFIKQTIGETLFDHLANGENIKVPKIQISINNIGDDDLRKYNTNHICKDNQFDLLIRYLCYLHVQIFFAGTFIKNDNSKQKDGKHNIDRFIHCIQQYKKIGDDDNRRYLYIRQSEFISDAFTEYDAASVRFVSMFKIEEEAISEKIYFNTAVRKTVSGIVNHHIFLGGFIKNNFTGAYPGMIEEFVFAIKSKKEKKKKKIFLIGGYGGTARDIADLVATSDELELQRIINKYTQYKSKAKEVKERTQTKKIAENFAIPTTIEEVFTLIFQLDYSDLGLSKEVFEILQISQNAQEVTNSIICSIHKEGF